MKIMSYNILSGGSDERGSRLPLVLETIRAHAPSMALIQEANHFQDNNRAILDATASALEYPYAALSVGSAPDPNYAFNVATLSKIPFTAINDFKGHMRNAALQTVVASRIGPVSICNVHLTPLSESQRVSELHHIIAEGSRYAGQIITGDLNSLSPQDQYDPAIVDAFNPTQLRKFTKDGALLHDTINLLLSAGFVDVAFTLGKNNELSVPTRMNVDAAHETPLRLDYVFASKSLAPYCTGFQVIKNSQTDYASDHYPILFELAREIFPNTP